MSRRFRCLSWSVFVRLVLSGAVVAGALPFVEAAVPAAVATESRPIVGGGTALVPATDRLGVVELWRKGGASTKEAAKAALVGDDVQFREFIATGQYAAIGEDYRAAVIGLALVGRQTIQSEASTALADGSWQVLGEFLTSGWKQAWLNDDHRETYRDATRGGIEVRAAANRALDAGDAAVQEFVASGKAEAEFDDLQKALFKLVHSSPTVAAAANAALDTENREVYEEFFRYGQFVAAARDVETATVSQLADQAKAASHQAVELNRRAKDASDQAVNAARLAKEAAERAGAEAAAASNSSARAGNAALRAGSLAEQAARAAQVAVSAANDAKAALHQASRASANAAAAAARAQRAAAGAHRAAVAAAYDSAQAGAARAAAQNARDAAAGAQSAAEAAGFAVDAIAASSGAADAAASAGRNAAHAANAAAAAANQSGVSRAESDRAKAASERARVAAASAERAAAHVTSLAQQAAGAAGEARQAAMDSVAHANAAAANADEAARQAGNAGFAAARSTEYAAAAQTAANASTVAVTRAKAIRDRARVADVERLAAESEFKKDVAAFDRGRVEAKEHAAAESATRARDAAATVSTLVPQLTAATSDLNERGGDVKKAIFGVMESGGPWARVAAENAMAGDPAAHKQFILVGLQTAKEQDQWDETVKPQTREPSGSTCRSRRVNQWRGSVNEFLTTGLKKLTIDDDRKNVWHGLRRGKAVKAAANAALDVDTDEAIYEFLEKTQHAAAVEDDERTVYAMLATATPELRVAAEVALEGPHSSLTKFLATGRHEAVRRDHDAASHAASIDAMIGHAEADAHTAHVSAQQAAETAARARAAAVEANGYAAQARQYANNAKASANQAHAFAAQATESANHAAESARTARAAADQARTDAHAAAQHAASAAVSANSARYAATAAARSARSAQNSAVQAGKGADLARQAAHEAIVIAINKQREEDEAADFQKAGSGEHDASTTQAEEDAARQAGGEAAVQELRDARALLSMGGLIAFLGHESGRFLLDVIGWTDLENCFTKGDLLACGLTGASFLPWGFAGRAGTKVIAKLIEIVPKVAVYMEKFAKAVNVVKKWAFVRKAAPVAAAIGRTTNPAFLEKYVPPWILGKYGNDSMEAAGFRASADTPFKSGKEISYEVKQPDGSIKMRRADGIDVDGNIWENKNAARVGGERNRMQIEDAIRHAKDDVNGSKRVKLQVRCDANGKMKGPKNAKSNEEEYYTKISQSILDLPDFKQIVDIGCIPHSY